MNKVTLSIFILSIILTSCKESTISVKGHISDSIQNTIMLFEPIHDFYNDYFAQPGFLVSPDVNGYFEKKIPLTKPNMFSLKIGNRAIWFYAEPGDVIELDIDFNKFTDVSSNGGIRFNGKNEKGNEYFNTYNYQLGKKFGDFEYYANDSLHFRRNRDFKVLDFALNKVTSYFDTLLQNKQITKGFYDGVVPGIKAMLITREIRYLFVEQKKIPFPETVKLANEIYKRYPVTLSMLKQHAFSNDIAYYYYNAIALKNYQSFHKTDSLIIVDSKRFFVNQNLVYWLYAPREIQEIYWAQSLLRLESRFPESYSHKDIEAFLALNPSSPVKDYLLAKNFDEELSINPEDSTSIKFINDTLSSTLAEVIKAHFSGQKVYVDFWASWCVPCKQEFAFIKELDSFFTINNIQKLYISFDFQEARDAMRRDIYAYNLKGYHMTLNEQVFKDVQKKIFENKELAIPRYLIIDESGKVVNTAAPRPSSGQQLFHTMKRDLKIRE